MIIRAEKEEGVSQPAASKWRSMDGHCSGSAAIVGAVLVLALFAMGVGLHPESVRNTGGALLVMDIVLVLLFGGAGVWAVRQRNAGVNASLKVGAVVGFVLGITHIVHHAVEFFVPLGGRTAPLLLGAGHMLLVFALFCAAGSAAWERTESVGLAMVAGIWAALLSVLIVIAFGLSSNLLFASRALIRLQEAFQGSGMSDAGAFVVRNGLEAASESLLRLPILGLILSLAGALANAWLSRCGRRGVVLVAWVTPFLFAAAALLLWYADSLERAARPPFIMTGLLLAAVSLSSAHSVWSVLRRAVREE
jgi:hypothetical protein